MSPGARRLCLNVLAARRQWAVGDLFDDPAALDAVLLDVAHGMPWGFWEHQYFEGRIEADELESLLGPLS